MRKKRTISHHARALHHEESCSVVSTRPQPGVRASWLKQAALGMFGLVIQSLADD